MLRKGDNCFMVWTISKITDIITLGFNINLWKRDTFCVVMSGYGYCVFGS